MKPTPLWRRYSRLFGPDPAADVKDELRLHLEAKIDELVSQGWRPKPPAKKPNASSATCVPFNKSA